MIRQLAHLCFFSDHVEPMLGFYGKLGLQVRFTLKNKSGVPFGYYLQCGNTTFIEVFDQAMAVAEWGGTVGPLNGVNGYRHFCLEVTGLEQFKQKLEAQGIAVSPITMGMDYSCQAWINDPDGNAIELMEYTDRSMQLTEPE